MEFVKKLFELKRNARQCSSEIERDIFSTMLIYFNPENIVFTWTNSLFASKIIFRDML